MPSMLGRFTEALEHLDLTPRHPIVPGGKSIWGGILYLLYIPFLVLYLYNSLVPLYGPLPSCCACSTYDTPSDSFIYMGNNATCSADTACRKKVEDDLAENCDAAVYYEAPLLDTIRIDIALIICAGMDDGAPCTEKCLDVSRRWLGASDYTSDLNRYQALARCPSQIGVCDFKALYEFGSTSKFPMSICRYPDLTSILTRLGAGLGLVNGLFVTVRMLARALWVRVAEKKEDDGKPKEYAAGLFYGLLFSYLSVTYFLVSSTASKRMRYGAQMGVGLLFVFLKTPLVVSLVYLLGQFWAPMMIYSFVSAVTYVILFRTLYCMLRLETRSRENRTQEEIALINDLPTSPEGRPKGPLQDRTPQGQDKQQIYQLSQQQLYDIVCQVIQSQQQATQQSQTEKSLTEIPQSEKSQKLLQPDKPQLSQRNLLQPDKPQLSQRNLLQTEPPEKVEQTEKSLLSQRHLLKVLSQPQQQPTEKQPDIQNSTNKYGTMDCEDWTVPLYPHSVWRNFLLGFAGNIFSFAYMLKLSWHRRNSGFFSGAMCGTSALMLCVAWAVMYAFQLWPEILFDFPFPVNYPKSTVYFQSAYFTYTSIFSLTFVYYLCSFLKARPEHNDTLVPGTKYQYRMAFTLSSLPVCIVFLVFFFGFYWPYTNTPLPNSIQDCHFPIYQVMIPFVGVIPGFIVFIVAKVSRIRWGAFAACGFSFLALSIVLNILIFQYCLGSTPHRRPFYPLVCTAELAGSFIVIYGSIRPNRVRHTRKYEDDTEAPTPVPE